MDILFIFVAKYLILVPILAVVWLFIKLPRSEWKKEGLRALAILILTFVLAKIGSHFYYDPRPFVQGGFTSLIPHAPDNGFPSDHVLLASALSAIVMCWKKRAGMALWLVAILIGISRVYVGVHHPIDVIFSLIFALVASLFVHYTVPIK